MNITKEKHRLMDTENKLGATNGEREGSGKRWGGGREKKGNQDGPSIPEKDL